MSLLVGAILAQDGLTNGAIYALIALALVMVFSVTKVILVPQGEIITFAALTLAALRQGVLPGTVWVILVGGLAAAALELFAYARGDRSPDRLKLALAYAALPALASLAAYASLGRDLSIWFDMGLMMLLVVPLGPLMYRLAFRPLGDASVLLNLIVAVAVHFVLMGIGLLAFGAEGVRTPPIVSGRTVLFGVPFSLQAMFVIGVALLGIVLMALFFGRTLAGKALRATAYNRTGARLVGIQTQSAALLAFTLAGILGALCGLLAAPITTIYYDTGFLIGLKGFIAAIFAGLASYPLAALGALLVGLLESYSAFFASTYKEAIVFALVIPILLWRSLRSHHVEEDEE